ncbi:MAG: translation initiation factor IF-2, partial [Candidatus Gastranaerophilaceae bacterium]
PEGGPQRQGFAPRPGFTPRPEGGPQRQGFAPRPGFPPRPEGTEGDKPFRFKQPIKRQFISQDAGHPPAPMATKGPVPGKFANKKKEKVAFGLTKEEKQEQAKLLQQQQKYKKKTKGGEEIQEKITEIIMDKPITVGEFADKMGVNVSEVVKTLMLSGIFATVNQTLDLETAKKVAEAFEITIQEEAAQEPQVEEEKKEKIIETSEKLSPRAPVVTIMGHVDHGKTTLLDAIRAIKHKIVSGEVGGITQSIGAYTVKTDHKKIVFLDTPGHEAFTAMRARGAKSTDIAVLVVAADDGIMPQTIEAISHAKAANVPIIVAVNKMDKPGADPDRVLTQLTEHGLVPEDWGGETICVKVSALLGDGIDELLEYILLVSEILELKADPEALATGVVIEAKLDKGKGPVATLLVQNGTLRKGDCLVVGNVGGKIRALLSDEGERLEKAEPSTPVEVLGLSEVPQAGDKFEITVCERDMKSLVASRKDQERETKFESMAPAQIRKEMMASDHKAAKDLNIIIKANTHGSAEAVSASIQQLQSKQIFPKILHTGVGDISEADVMLATTSNAIIIGFSVKEDQNAARIASQEGVEIKKYEIIYQILEDIEKTMLGLIKPEFKEVEVGVAEVRQIFTIGKSDKIAGCYVTEGKVIRNKPAVVERNGKQIFKGNLDQLKRFKDDAKEVNTGYECGISFDKFNDLVEGDLIRVFTTEEIEKNLLT